MSAERAEEEVSRAGAVQHMMTANPAALPPSCSLKWKSQKRTPVLCQITFPRIMVREEYLSDGAKRAEFVTDIDQPNHRKPDVPTAPFASSLRLYPKRPRAIIVDRDALVCSDPGLPL